MDAAKTKHASNRMQQRGVSASFLQRILDNADIERPANDNCRSLQVSRTLARILGDDRLGQFYVIWSDDSGSVVTVAPDRKAKSRRISLVQKEANDD